MSEAKKQWDAHVEGALAAKDSISVVDLEWDAAVLYAHNRIRALLDRIDELEGDAERYRWIRANCLSVTDLAATRIGASDEAIDKARGQ